MVPGQEANGNNFGNLFFDLVDNNSKMSVYIRIASMR